MCLYFCVKDKQIFSFLNNWFDMILISYFKTKQSFVNKYLSIFSHKYKVRYLSRIIDFNFLIIMFQVKVVLKE